MRKHRIRPNDQKLGELVLLISEWSQADPKFGAVKLNKLLFHCDFAAYLTYGQPITGQEYFALPQGPAPRRLKLVTDAMKKKQELAYQNVVHYGYTQQRPIALRSPNVSVFSSREMHLIRETIEKFWKMGATEISEQSHLFMGWKVARVKETIPYATALIGRRPPTPEERQRGRALREMAAEHLRAHR